jgi:hypothetical protein
VQQQQEQQQQQQQQQLVRSDVNMARSEATITTAGLEDTIELASSG